MHFVVSRKLSNCSKKLSEIIIHIQRSPYRFIEQIWGTRTLTRKTSWTSRSQISLDYTLLHGPARKFPPLYLFMHEKMDKPVRNSLLQTAQEGGLGSCFLFINYYCLVLCRQESSNIAKQRPYAVYEEITDFMSSLYNKTWSVKCPKPSVIKQHTLKWGFSDLTPN